MSISKHIPWLRKGYCRSGNNELQEYKNVKAFLNVIRKCEGTDGPNGYLMLFGGDLFDNFNDHPDILVSKSGYDSTAAGAYQILTKTWKTVIQPLASLDDFSPESQDEAAKVLIEHRGALENVKKGELYEALKKCSWEWASLPPGRYGQPIKTFDQVKEYFKQEGGIIKDQEEHDNIIINQSTII